MSLRPKPFKDRVFFITGASSGMGLVTVRMATKRGARAVRTRKQEIPGCQRRQHGC